MNRSYKMKYLSILIILLFTSCNQITGNVELSQNNIEESSEAITDSIEVFDLPIANHFDFPVGKPDAKGYYNAQAFGKNNHLGDDWNAVTGGNSDLGDPIYAIANGKVTFAEDIIINDVLLSNQQNTDIDTGVEVVAQVAHATYTAAFFDFVVKKGTNVRSGTVYACHNGDTTPLVEFTETSDTIMGYDVFKYNGVYLTTEDLYV